MRYSHPFLVLQKHYSMFWEATQKTQKEPQRLNQKLWREMVGLWFCCNGNKWQCWCHCMYTGRLKPGKQIWQKVFSQNGKSHSFQTLLLPKSFLAKQKNILHIAAWYECYKTTVNHIHTDLWKRLKNKDYTTYLNQICVISLFVCYYNFFFHLMLTGRMEIQIRYIL